MIPAYITQKALEYGYEINDELFEQHKKLARYFGHRIADSFFHLQTQSNGKGFNGLIYFQYRCSKCDDIICIIDNNIDSVYKREERYCEQVRLLF